MKNQIEEVREDIEEVNKKQMNAYELAINTLEQNNKRERFIVRILLVIILILLGINAYFSYVFTTTTVAEETTWTQDGEWNAINDDGTMINGDYPYGETNEENN